MSGFPPLLPVMSIEALVCHSQNVARSVFTLVACARLMAENIVLRIFSVRCHTGLIAHFDSWWAIWIETRQECLLIDHFILQLDAGASRLHEHLHAFLFSVHLNADWSQAASYQSIDLFSSFDNSFALCSPVVMRDDSSSKRDQRWVLLVLLILFHGWWEVFDLDIARRLVQSSCHSERLWLKLAFLVNQRFRPNCWCCLSATLDRVWQQWASCESRCFNI